MSRRIGILHPGDLLATALRERLAERPELGDVTLITTDEEEVGTLTDVAGGAALVQQLEDPDRFDLLLCCGPIEAVRPVLKRLGPGTRAIVLSPDADDRDGQPLVDGINLAELPEGVLRSPRAETILLANLLAPLWPLGVARATATVLQPASAIGPARALDDLLDQARNLLAFQPIEPSGSFDHQQVFNVLPTDLGPVVGRELGEVLGADRPVGVQVLRAAVFHSLSASVWLELDRARSGEELREALERQPGVRIVERPEELGPIDAAQSDELLVGAITTATEPTATAWIWAVMDNLRLGGADNALAIAARLP